MGFEVQNQEEGKVASFLTTSATAFTKNNAVKYTSGYLAAAASGDASVDYISMESKTSATGDGADTLLVYRVDPSVIVHALCSTTPVQATHVGNRYDISAAGTIDLGNSTDKIFLVDRIVNATDKIVEGRFMQQIA
jgi:hypothetical protein